MVYAGKNISNNFVCVFPANHKSRLTDLSNQMRAKIAQYPYMITNNYAEDKHGTQWWSFLDKQKKEYALLIQLLWHYWTTRFPCWKRQKNIQKGHNKYATDIQKGQWSHPFWNGASKGTNISAWFRKNSNSYWIRHSSSSDSLKSSGSTKELKTRCRCTPWTIACRASTLIIVNLLHSISIWIYLNHCKGAWRLRPN